MAGILGSTSGNLTLRNCENSGHRTWSSRSRQSRMERGIAASAAFSAFPLNTKASNKCLIESCTNSGTEVCDADAKTQTGGILGLVRNLTLNDISNHRMSLPTQEVSPTHMRTVAMCRQSYCHFCQRIRTLRTLSHRQRKWYQSTKSSGNHGRQLFHLCCRQYHRLQFWNMGHFQCQVQIKAVLCFITTIYKTIVKA